MSNGLITDGGKTGLGGVGEPLILSLFLKLALPASIPILTFSNA